MIRNSLKPYRQPIQGDIKCHTKVLQNLTANIKTQRHISRRKSRLEAKFFFNPSPDVKSSFLLIDVALGAQLYFIPPKIRKSVDFARIIRFELQRNTAKESS